MLSQVFLLGLVLIYPAQGDLFQDVDSFHNLESQFQPHVWDQPRFKKKSIAADSLVKNRIPLSSEYKDPTPASSEDKPMVIETTKENYDKSILNPKKENQGCKHFRGLLLFDGIFNLVDIDDFPLDKPEAQLLELFGFMSKKWWKGKNVCIEREESSGDEDLEPINYFSTSVSLSNCTETKDKYECITKINIHGMVKTITVRYKCCYGFQKTLHSDGCDTQVYLKPGLLQILDDLKCIEFKGLVKSSGLEDTFTNGNYTLFVPSDDAINDYNNKINDMNKTELTRRRPANKPLTGKEFVVSHVTNGFYRIGDLQNEQKLQSENNKKSIRINMYATQTKEKMLTANCARIKNGNILVENVVVYVLDKVIKPTGDSIENIIDNHPKLTTFKRVMKETDIPSYFKPDGHYTIFAPTDEAFNKLDEIERQKLLSGRGCASSILKHHIAPHTVCSSAIIGNVTIPNIEDMFIYIKRTLDDELIFEQEAKIVDTDIIGSNGIIHLIDTLTYPESGQYTSCVLKFRHFDKFQEIVDKAGFSDELNNFENATVFVPSNYAFDELHIQKYLEQIGDDKEKLKEIIRYHVTEGEMQYSDVINNMLIASKDAGKKLRVNLYSNFSLNGPILAFTVNCHEFTIETKSCGSIAYKIDTVLVPPTKTLFELINDDDRYTTLKQMVKGTEVEKILQDKTKSITFLAPTDETFATLEDTERKALLDSKEKAEELLKAHILTEVLCCSSAPWDFKRDVSTLGNQSVAMGLDIYHIKVNNAVITSCDNLATNGVLHTINKVLAP